nr:putative RNA-directed DNA polymerase, eukaryota, reverse transcriptase zinc-binding domain protein [Tanacetum cinerariifolium]
DLFQACKQYGHVVDSFIPNKRDKYGKRFGFVRFINVFNTERLVNNMCTVWIDQYKVQPNIAHFQRSHGKGSKADVTNSYSQKIPNDTKKMNTFSKGDKSFAGVVKGKVIPSGEDMKTELVLVLGDDCLGSKDLSLTLFGRVKEFALLANLKVVFGDEGFSDIVIKIAWVEVEGVPLKLWSGNTFRRIASWVPDFTDDIEDEDQEDMESNPESIDNRMSGNHANCLNDSGLGNDSDMEEIPETCFEDGKPMNCKDDGVNYSSKMENLEDPFKIYPLLNKQKSDDGSNNKMGDSLEHPPGFTPLNEEDKISHDDGEKHFNINVDVTSAPREKSKVECNSYQNSLENKESGHESMASGHLKQSVCPRTGGSILSLLEEVLKVGQVMGYRMEGCMANMEEIIETNNIYRGFLHHEISKWRGEVIIMGDFNEVRFSSDRFGSNFNEHGDHLFNSFIADSGLVEVPLGGCHFNWSLKTAKKMSKLDRFLVSENLLVSCPYLTTVTLERYLSDHRPILLREYQYDYGPTPFRFFHHWMQTDGFDKIVSDSWKNRPSGGANDIKNLMHKLKHLKHNIREWNKHNIVTRRNTKTQYKKKLEAVDQILDSGQGVEEDIRERSEIIRKLQNCDEIDSLELAQKANIQWAIEGDENSKEFPNRLQSDQSCDLEMSVSNEEIKKAVWDCGTDKAPGPDGFTFGFFRHFWHIVKKDVCNAVSYFFIHDDLPIGCNSSFIALIPKIPDANVVKDFRPISFIGSVYEIIAKILSNRLVNVLGDIVSEVQSAFVANRQILDGPFILNEVIQWCKAKKKQTLIFKVYFEKAYDSVRWDFLDDVLCKFGFGDKWRRWIQCCLQSSRGSIILNGSPTKEFKFGKGLKQGDPSSPFLFILIMESLHLSFQRVMDAGLFHGIKLHDSVTLSHLFYADDAIFVGQWSQRNISTLTHVLKCFHMASGLKINMCKSKILGIHVNNDNVSRAAEYLGCQILKMPFSYLGSMVGGNMHRLHSWDDTVDRVRNRLSKWKMKMLSSGCRLTLVKSVLESMPIFHMSLFKVPA